MQGYSAAQLVPRCRDDLNHITFRALSLLASLVWLRNCALAPSKGLRLTEPPILFYLQTGYNVGW